MMNATADKIIRLLRRTHGRYVDSIGIPKIANNLLILDDGRVCPASASDECLRNFKLVTNSLRVSKACILRINPSLRADDLMSTVYLINRSSSQVKIVSVGTLANLGYTFERVLSVNT